MACAPVSQPSGTTTDIVASTERAAEPGESRWRELLQAHETGVRREVDAYGGRLIKGLGDGYLSTFDGPARAIRCAGAIAKEAASLDIQVRAGVHTGECERIGDDVAGMAVHIAARVAAKAGPGETFVSSAIRDIVVGSGIEFDDRGTHELKGVPGTWTLLAVTGTGGSHAPQATPQPARDPLAPDLGLAKPGDRAMLRLARSAPSVGQALSRIATRRRA